VAEKPHDAVVKFDTYRNLQRHRAVLSAIARHLVVTIAALAVNPLTAQIKECQSNINLRLPSRFNLSRLPPSERLWICETTVLYEFLFVFYYILFIFSFQRLDALTWFHLMMHGSNEKMTRSSLVVTCHDRRGSCVVMTADGPASSLTALNVMCFWLRICVQPLTSNFLLIWFILTFTLKLTTLLVSRNKHTMAFVRLVRTRAANAVCNLRIKIRYTSQSAHMAMHHIMTSMHWVTDYLICSFWV